MMNSAFPLVVQVRGDRHGGSGPAADGLSLSEHQTLRGEFPAHGGQAAGVQRTGPAGPGNQLGKTRTSVWLKQKVTVKLSSFFILYKALLGYFAEQKSRNVSTDCSNSETQMVP